MIVRCIFRLFRTCRQQIITMTFIIFLFQKQVPMPLATIRLVVDFLNHENIDIRKVRTHPMHSSIHSSCFSDR